MHPALELLSKLAPLEALEAIGAPLAGIRIIDVTGSLIRAPAITFRASEIGLDRFGLNLPNDRLVEVLAAEAAANDRIIWRDARLTGLSAHGEGVVLDLDDGGAPLEADLAVGADGKTSPLRDLAGIAARRWSYPQTALTFHVRHQRDHFDISTEFQTREGPFTLVPLSDRLSSVVWMMKPDRAETLLALDDAAFAREAEQQSQRMLGKLTLASGRAAIPMGGLSASSLAKGRIALVGEAAHAFPPIGAQGLNLSLRDVRDLVTALSGSGDVAARLQRYASMRQADVALRTTAVDALNRSLISDFLPFDALRVLGMSAVGAFSPLRRAVMRAGIGDMAGLFPKLPERPRFLQGNRSAGR